MCSDRAKNNRKMYLFRRKSDNSCLKFHCLELSDTELNDIKTLVMENGGEMGEDAQLPVKFMQRTKYRSGMYPLYRLYDIEYIGACVKKSSLVDPIPFRLGPKKLGEHCIISNFIYGYCHYEKISKIVIAQGSPDILDSSFTSGDETLENDFPLGNSHNNRSSRIFRTRLAVRSSQDTVLDKTGQSQDLQRNQSIESSRLSIDESQSVVSQTYIRRLRTFANGSDTPTGGESPVHSGESRSSNFEYGEDNKPDLDERSLNSNGVHHQSHSPETVITRSLDMQNSTYEAPTNFVEVKKEILDPLDLRSPDSDSILRQANPPEAGAMDGSSDERAMNLTTSPNQSPQAPKSPCSSDAVIFPRRNLKRYAVPSGSSKIPEPIKIYPRLTVIAEAKCLSPNPTINGKKKSSRIASKNSNMQELNMTNGVYATTEYVRCDNDKNVTPWNNPTSSSKKLLNPIHRSTTGMSSKNTNETSVIEEPLFEFKDTNETKYTTSTRPKSPLNAEVWNKPGTSGLNPREQTVDNVSSVLDNRLSDEDTTELTTSRRGVTQCSQRISSDSSGSGNEDNVKSNCDKQTNGKPRQNRDPLRFTSHEKQQSRQNLIVVKRKKKVEPNKTRLHKKSDNYYINSDSDEEIKSTSTESKKHECVEFPRQNLGVMSPESEPEEATYKVTQKKDVQSSLGLNNGYKDSNRSRRRYASDDSSDGVYCEKKIVFSEYAKRKKALRYAKAWRSQLVANRSEKFEATHMHYTRHEQKLMVDYLLTYENVQHVCPKGLKVWNEMIKRGILPHRTPQSLQNHFVKLLLPNIDDYFVYMSEEHQKQFKALQSGSRKFYK